MYLSNGSFTYDEIYNMESYKIEYYVTKLQNRIIEKNNS
jgi:hypothetical protein